MAQLGDARLGVEERRVLADDLGDEVGADLVAVKAPSREVLAVLWLSLVAAVAFALA